MSTEIAKAVRRDGHRMLAELIPPLQPVSGETVANILPVLEERWSKAAIQCHQRALEAAETGNYNAANRWIWCAGVATDKVNALKGRPAEIIGHVHAHRHELMPLMDKLSTALRGADERVASVGRLVSQHLVGPKSITVIEARAAQKLSVSASPTSPSPSSAPSSPPDE